MKSYKELKAKLNLCYEISVFMELIDNNIDAKTKLKKYISFKIEQLLNEIKTTRDSGTILKSE